VRRAVDFMTKIQRHRSLEEKSCATIDVAFAHIIYGSAVAFAHIVRRTNDSGKELA